MALKGLPFVRRAVSLLRRRPGDDSAGQLAVLETLRVRDFRYFWAGNALSFISLNMRTLAQGWLVLELTNSKFWVGLTNGLPALPIVAISLLAGVLTDRVDGRTLLIRARFGAAGIAFLVAGLITTQAITLWQIVVLAILAAGVQASALPATNTYLMDLVGRQRLLNANALNGTAMHLGTIIGPAVGGVIIASLGVGAAFYLIGGAYLVACLVLLRIHGPGKPRPGRDTSLLRDLLDGLVYVRRTSHVAWLLGLAVVALFAAIFMPLLPVYARDVLHVGSQGYGALMGAWGIGALVGSGWLIMAGEVRRKARLLVLGSLLWSAGMIVFGFSRSFPLSLACLFVMGFAPPLWMNTMRTVLQTSVPEDMRGRVMGILTMTMQVVSLGWLLGGALATAFSNEVALVIGGTVFAGSNLLAYARSPEVRHIT